MPFWGLLPEFSPVDQDGPVRSQWNQQERKREIVARKTPQSPQNGIKVLSLKPFFFSFFDHVELFLQRFLSSFDLGQNYRDWVFFSNGICRIRSSPPKSLGV
jgi:hypothetical protein